jgi:hypothetical protein
MTEARIIRRHGSKDPLGAPNEGLLVLGMPIQQPRRRP